VAKSLLASFEELQNMHTPIVTNWKKR